MSGAATPAAVLRGVGRSYGRRTALSAVDLEIGPGVTGVLGPNGAGKTTLLRLLATTLIPSTGRLRLLGLDPCRERDRRAIRRHLGYLPQETGLYPRFTAFEFVDYVAALKELDGVRQPEVRRTLEAVGLGADMHRRLSGLSGGARRRVVLAQALLGRPELLVLDEPTTGLDPEQRIAFRNTIEAVGRTATVVLSTHQTEDVGPLCDRVVVLDRGRVCWMGATRDFARTASGRVWLTRLPDPAARHWWRTTEGEVRNVGTAPRGARLVAPTVEDAYLLMVGTVP